MSPASIFLNAESARQNYFPMEISSFSFIKTAKKFLCKLHATCIFEDVKKSF